MCKTVILRLNSRCPAPQQAQAFMLGVLGGGVRVVLAHPALLPCSLLPPVDAEWEEAELQVRTEPGCPDKGRLCH